MGKWKVAELCPLTGTWHDFGLWDILTRYQEPSNCLELRSHDVVLPTVSSVLHMPCHLFLRITSPGNSSLTYPDTSFLSPYTTPAINRCLRKASIILHYKYKFTHLSLLPGVRLGPLLSIISTKYASYRICLINICWINRKLLSRPMSFQICSRIKITWETHRNNRNMGSQSYWITTSMAKTTKLQYSYSHCGALRPRLQSFLPGNLPIPRI